jgi:uncharacterized membrane protein
MSPNPYRAWLLAVALAPLSIGSLVWAVGFFTGQSLVGLGQMAWGGGMVQFGVLLLALWLVVSAILYGLQRLASQDGQAAAAEPAEKRRVNLGGHIDLR